MKIDRHLARRDLILANALIRKQNSQVLLIGFDGDTQLKLSAHLDEILLETHVVAEPFDGLAAMIEDPAVWLACIVDVTCFTSEEAFVTFQQLFAFETFDGQAIGMILGNAKTNLFCQHQAEPIAHADMAVGDVADRETLDRALKAVLFRRGYHDENVLVELRSKPGCTAQPELAPARVLSGDEIHT